MRNIFLGKPAVLKDLLYLKADQTVKEFFYTRL